MLSVYHMVKADAAHIVSIDRLYKECTIQIIKLGLTTKLTYHILRIVFMIETEDESE